MPQSTSPSTLLVASHQTHPTLATTELIHVIRATKKQHHRLDITAYPTPGHKVIEQNRQADRKAKFAAMYSHNHSNSTSLPQFLRSPPPANLAALKQPHRIETAANDAMSPFITLIDIPFIESTITRQKGIFGDESIMEP